MALGTRTIVAVGLLCLSLSACGSELETTVEYNRSVEDLYFEAGPCLGLIRGAERSSPPFNRHSTITVENVEQDVSADFLNYRISGTLEDKFQKTTREYAWICDIRVDTENEKLDASLISIIRQSE